MLSLRVQVCSSSLHHSSPEQSASTLHPLMHSPLDGSQTVPTWPAQSTSAAHFPHVPCSAPDKEQNGAAALVHGLLAVEPLSPLHFTHRECSRSQIGFLPPQSSEELHWTQLPWLRLHTGVSPEHCESSVQSTHLPCSAPVSPQWPERHTLPASALVHGPVPLAKPHASSWVSQTPLTHTNVAAGSEHPPSSVGPACGGSDPGGGARSRPASRAWPPPAARRHRRAGRARRPAHPPAAGG